MRNKTSYICSRLVLGTLNWQPDGSNTNSEYSGCEISALICFAYYAALTIILQRCFCDLSITFPAILTILERLFLPVALKLPLHVWSECTIRLSTVLLLKQLSFSLWQSVRPLGIALYLIGKQLLLCCFITQVFFVVVESTPYGVCFTVATHVHSVDVGGKVALR